MHVCKQKPNQIPINMAKKGCLLYKEVLDGRAHAHAHTRVIAHKIKNDEGTVSNGMMFIQVSLKNIRWLNRGHHTISLSFIKKENVL
jgi:hypothetical protein